jgi:hypothetical protein
MRPDDPGSREMPPAAKGGKGPLAENTHEKELLNVFDMERTMGDGNAAT